MGVGVRARSELGPFHFHARSQDYLSHVLIPHGLVLDRVEKLAADIIECFPKSTPHMLVVLKVRGRSAQDWGAREGAGAGCIFRFSAYVRIPRSPVSFRRTRVVAAPSPGPKMLLHRPHPCVCASAQGGSEFATDLTRAMRKRHTYSELAMHVPFTVDFVRVKSYEGTESSGKGAWGSRRQRVASVHNSPLPAPRSHHLGH